jgi:hypothetical protein
MIETHREENEINEAEFQLRNNAILEREEMLQGELEDEPEDVNEEVESEYEDDEMIYN